MKQGHYGQHAEKMMTNLLDEMKKRKKDVKSQAGGQDLSIGTRDAPGLN
jgi:hypothetical protein